YGPQAPQSTASPGPGKARTNPRGPPGGPATPQQGQAAPYPGSPAIPRPTPPPGQQQQQLALAQQQQQQQIPDVGNMLADLEVDQLPPNLKREGSDWFAIFNPRVWDIASRTIKHQFAGHEQDIYSLDFASNGRHIASGSGDRT
ncbi:general transcription repressor, partial [Cryomyces antarcticus]